MLSWLQRNKTSVVCLIFLIEMMEDVTHQRRRLAGWTVVHSSPWPAQLQVWETLLLTVEWMERKSRYPRDWKLSLDTGSAQSHGWKGGGERAGDRCFLSVHCHRRKYKLWLGKKVKTERAAGLTGGRAGSQPAAETWGSAKPCKASCSSLQFW